GADRLRRMTRAGGRDDDAIEVEVDQVLEGLAACGGRGNRRRRHERGAVDVGETGDLDQAARHQRLEPVPPDPPEAETPEARPHQLTVTTALRKPSGRSRIQPKAWPTSP